jgi:hypothetical protein
MPLGKRIRLIAEILWILIRGWKLGVDSNWHVILLSIEYLLYVKKENLENSKRWITSKSLTNKIKRAISSLQNPLKEIQKSSLNASMLLALSLLPA